MDFDFVFGGYKLLSPKRDRPLKLRLLAGRLLTGRFHLSGLSRLDLIE
jgi:hypothetical protein